MAAAGLCIGVGGFSDPVEVPGMSHFLEHMIIMGSEKYPEKNDFSSFIDTRGGFTNAFTEVEATTFYFECFEKQLYEAIDRWSQFFISPLMQKEAIAHEREAVDSEFQMFLPNDMVRKEQLLLSLAKQDSSVNFFTCGNLKTLTENISDEQLYESVCAYRKQHYSAHRMTLAIQARLPIDTLQNFVVEFFSKVPNNELPTNNCSIFSNRLFDTPEFNRIYFVKPINDVIELNVNWVLPSLQTKYKIKPINYLSYLISDEGKGSLSSYLKKRMWAISVNVNYDNNSIYTSLNIVIELTKEGLDRKFEVIKALFSYINLLKAVGPQERIYEDLKLMADTEFKFDGEHTSCFTILNLCPNMSLYPPEHIITGPRLFYEYDPDTITMIMEYLIPNKMNIMIVAKDVPDGLTFGKTEKWFGTEYIDIEIPEELKIQWETVEPDPELNVPPPNAYLTSNFELLPEVDDHPDYPQKLIDNSKCELWYRKDQKFKLPLARYNFYLISTSAVESPKTYVMLNLFVHLLTFCLEEEVYPCYKANLTLSCNSILAKGMSFEVAGYNEKLPMLVELMTKYIKNLKEHVNEQIFLRVKDKTLKTHFSYILQPYFLSYYLHFRLLLNNCYTPLHSYNELARLTYSDMVEFMEDYGKHLYVKVLVQGNVSPEVATGVVDTFLESMEFDEISKENYPQLIMAQVPSGERCLLVESFNKKYSNCLTSNYYQVGPFSLKDSVIIDLIMLIIEEPLFNTLWNIEQLGNIVTCFRVNNFGYLGFSINISSQSNKFTTQHLDSRIEEFLKKSQDIVKETTTEAFEKIKNDLIKSKEHCDDNLEEEVSKNWNEIVDECYMFDRKKLEVETVKMITLDDVASWWSKYNHFGNQEHFRKISIQVVGHVFDKNTPEEEKSEINETDVTHITLKILGNNAETLMEGKEPDYFIEDIDSFKEKLCEFPIEN